MKALSKVLFAFLAIVARLLQGILDLFAAFLGNYYSFRFAATTRRLGLISVPPSDQRGFIVIQVDGVSGEYMDWAMSHGYAPTIQRLQRRDGFTLCKWNPGLPCTTPAVQAALLYGCSDGLPGYRWYDKALGRPVVCSSPQDAHDIQERLARGRVGLLRGGSSYMNMFDGEASLAMFTLGSVGRKSFFSEVRGIGFFCCSFSIPCALSKRFGYRSGST